MPSYDVSILIKAKDEASEVIKGISSSIQQEAKNIRASSDLLRTFGFGLTAIGAAGMKATDDARHLNASLAVTALTIGSTTEAMRKAAMATADVSTPLGDVAATYDLLARAGLRNVDVIDSVTRTMDSLGNAIGMSASQVADIMIPALKAYGIDLKDAGKYVDSFTWLVRYTTVDLGDFASVLRYFATDMDKLNLSIQDTVAILAVYESRGMSGADATRALKRDITEAVSSGKSLAAVMGLSQEELKGYTDQISAATGKTDEFGKIANTQYGFMDKVKNVFQEASVSIGTILEPLDTATTLMTFLGGASLFLSTKMGATLVGAILAAARAMWTFVASEIAALAFMGIPGWVALAAGAGLIATAFGIYGLTRLGGGGATPALGGLAPTTKAEDIIELPTFAGGGIVPGPTGAPVLAVVHGQERISPPGGGNVSITLNVGNMWGSRADAEKLLDMIQRGLRSRQRHQLGEAVY